MASVVAVVVVARAAAAVRGVALASPQARP
jgi:hypothetical protein